MTRIRWDRRQLLQVVGGLVTVGSWSHWTGSPEANRATSSLRAQPLPIQPRSAWGAAPPRAGMRAHTIERVTVHHTGSPAWYGIPSVPAYLRQIHAFHTGPERGWPDIAYHLLVDLDGVIWEGRSLEVAGDTATSYDPAGHALIAVLGDYDAQSPNEAQVEAVRETVRWLLEVYALDRSVVGAHRDYAATACPGRNVDLRAVSHQPSGHHRWVSVIHWSTMALRTTTKLHKSDLMADG